MLKFNILTNSRPTSDLGTSLVVGCTSGNIKITPDFAKLIGVAPKHRLIVAEDLENPGSFYAFADNTDKKVGSLLAKSGSYFQMSSQNAWDILGGDEDLNRFFKVEGEVIDMDGLKVVKIVHDRDEEKTARVASEKVEGDAEIKEAAPVDFEESADDEFEQI